MKKLFLIILTLTLNIFTYGQLHVDSFYVDKTEFLIHKSILEFDSIPQSELKTRVLEWAGQTFVNANEVLVSETLNQVVFNYIINNFTFKNLGFSYTEKWYIRLIVKIKDNKIMLLFYDDGNVGGLKGDIFVRPKSIHFLTYYKGKDFINNKSVIDGMMKVKQSLLDSEKTINSLILNNQINDW